MELFEDRVETYKGKKITYDITYNLVEIEGLDERFTSFAKAREWLDNPANAIKAAAAAAKDKKAAKSTAVANA